MVNQPRLDARDEAKEERALPFVGPPESIGSDPFVNVDLWRITSLSLL
jgi:hypothetical protein